MSLQDKIEDIMEDDSYRWDDNMKHHRPTKAEKARDCINEVREHDKHEHASFALECSEQARADERERCSKQAWYRAAELGVSGPVREAIVEAIKAE